MIESNSKLNEPSDPSDRWFILLLVSLNYFTLFLHREMIFFVLPPLKETLGLSEVQQGWLMPAFIFPYGFSQFFMGYLSDRFRRRNILIYSLTASVLALGAMAWADSFRQLRVLRACLGFAQAASVPAIGGIMADCFSPKIRSTAVAIYLMSQTAAVIAAGWAGGSIAEAPSWTLPLVGDLAGWRTAMLAFSLIGAGLIVILTLFLREPERTERSQGKSLSSEEGSHGFWKTLHSVLRVPSFWILAIIFLLFALVMTARSGWLAKYFHDTFDMTLGDAGRFSTVWIQISSIVGLLLGGVVADRWSRRWRGGRVATCAIAMVAWIPALLIIGTSESEWLIATAMVFFGLALGVYNTNLWTTTFEVIDPAARSTSLGLLNVFSSFPSLASPFIGALKDQGYIDNYGSAFTGLSGVALIIVLLFVLHIWVTLPRDFIGPEAKSE